MPPSASSGKPFSTPGKRQTDAGSIDTPLTTSADSVLDPFLAVSHRSLGIVPEILVDFVYLETAIVINAELIAAARNIRCCSRRLQHASSGHLNIIPRYRTGVNGRRHSHWAVKRSHRPLLPTEPLWDHHCCGDAIFTVKTRPTRRKKK